MRVRFIVPGIALVCLLLPVQRAYADPPLAGFLVDLLYRSIVMKSTTNTIAGNPHEAHFLPGLAQTAAPFELNKALVSQLATFPIGSSSGAASPIRSIRNPARSPDRARVSVRLSPSAR